MSERNGTSKTLPTTERESLIDARRESTARERALALLAAGEVVALPTETVYALAARADLRAGIENLARAKGRGTELGPTWHVPSSAALDAFPRVSPMARRLAQRYWPGPLTLVLPGVPAGLELAARDGWTGVRAPAHPFTAGLLAAASFPIVLAGAQRPAEPPATEADVVLARFDGRVALVVDGGPARLRESSCILRLGRGRFDLLREGLFTLEQLRAAAGLRIAFVCTGNTCRSPMAEALARRLLAERLETTPGRLGDMGFELASMGVFARPGDPASKGALAAMAEDGIDLAEHRARAAIPEVIARHDRVYCMTRSHREALLALLPPGKAAHVDLLDPRGADVPDPFGGGRNEYRAAADRIAGALRARLDDWA
ncbi:MAG: Sua5/YciO/YrdC/YwlC family protein [Planctomycetes bacterium]|nr:Sua5/YciO/YrdC/YwlC family protein [Planctomycetota bacterium]